MGVGERGQLRLRGKWGNRAACIGACADARVHRDSNGHETRVLQTAELGERRGAAERVPPVPEQWRLGVQSVWYVVCRRVWWGAPRRGHLIGAAVPTRGQTSSVVPDRLWAITTREVYTPVSRGFEELIKL